LNGNGAIDLIGTTSNISITRPATFRRRHHSPPYNILCAYPQGLHPNGRPKIGTFVVPKLWTFISFSNIFKKKCKDIIL